MLPSNTLGYDRAITIFAPDGRLYQVEYANEAVRRGTLTLGIKTKEGVILAGYKRASNKLEDINFIHKIYKIDDHVGTSISGLHADGRRLIDYARTIAQWSRINYGEEVLIKNLTKIICDLKQYYTQHAFARPFGVALLIAGVDRTGAQLYSTGASGSFWGWKATAIGMNSEKAHEILAKSYKFDMSIEESLILGAKTIKDVLKVDLNEDNLELAKVSVEGKKFTILSKNEVREILDKISE
ncbi:MAG: archaeal proteasome endopeptidase complex subunit alpha [Candidatus Asgardarchaeia archaeon]